MRMFFIREGSSGNWNNSLKETVSSNTLPSPASDISPWKLLRFWLKFPTGIMRWKSMTIRNLSSGIIKTGGILRSCDTLSGGETFITSLSLALALSSAIQLNGTAPLELFFLDEGFGSLDEELLDVVMTSLERLQNRNRSIGIITHVEAIQARVPVKLIVTPSDISQNGSVIRLEYS